MTKRKKRTKRQAVSKKRKGQKAVPGDIKKGGGFAKGNKCGAKIKPGERLPGAGRPRGPDLSRLLRETLDEGYQGDEEKFEGKTNGEVLIDRAIEMGQLGHFKFFENIFDRIEGKIPTTIFQNTGMLNHLSEKELDDLIKGNIEDPGKGRDSPPGKRRTRKT